MAKTPDYVTRKELTQLQKNFDKQLKQLTKELKSDIKMLSQNKKTPKKSTKTKNAVVASS